MDENGNTSRRRRGRRGSGREKEEEEAEEVSKKESIHQRTCKYRMRFSSCASLIT
jgi:hypothetical protein